MSVNASIEVRGEWRFEYIAGALIKPTEKKLAHHTEQLRVWKRNFHEAEMKARGSYMDVREVKRGQWQVTVELSDEVCAALCEARDKIKHHEALVEEYAAYLAQFKRASSDTRMLALGDMEFFGLNDQEEEKD